MTLVMRNNSFHFSNAEETLAWGRLLGEQVLPGTVLALFGDLGAGKTTLIKGLIQAAAGIDPRHVSSPTFTYLNIYSGRKELYHFDLYRLHQEEDFLALGFHEYFNAEGICCIEWPEKISSLLPEHTLAIEIVYTGEHTRTLTIKQS